MLVGFILAIGFALQDGENSTEIEKGAVDLKAVDAERQKLTPNCVFLILPLLIRSSRCRLKKPSTKAKFNWEKKITCHRKTTDDPLFRAVENFHSFWQYLNILSVMRKTNFLNFSVNRSIFVSDRLWSFSYYDFPLSRQLLRPTTVSLSRLIQHKMNRFSHVEAIYRTIYSSLHTFICLQIPHTPWKIIQRKFEWERKFNVLFSIVRKNIKEWKMDKVLARL